MNDAIKDPIEPAEVLAEVANLESRDLFVARIAPDGDVTMHWTSMQIRDLVWIKESLQHLIINMLDGAQKAKKAGEMS